MATLPIPNDWDGESWKCWVVQWPDSILWRAILWGFVTTPSRGRFWDGRTGNIKDTQAIGQEIISRNIPMEESLMSCNDEALSLLQGMIDAINAIANKPCCPGGTNSGSRGSGTSQVPPNTYNQNETPNTPPDGFEDMEDYRSHKCNQAQDILNALKADLVGLSGISYAAATPTGLIGFVITILLTPVPYDDLIALLGFLIYSALNYSLLAEMAGQIDDNNETLLCALYNAPSSESAKSLLLAEFEEIAGDTFPNPNDADWVVEACSYFLTYDNLNRLFEPTPTQSQNADCSGCTSNACDIPYEGMITWDWGIPDEIEPGLWEVIAEEGSGWNCAPAYEVAFNVGDGDPFQVCGMEVISGSVEGDTGGICINGANVAVSNSTTGYCDAPVTPLATIEELPDGGFDYRWLVIVSCSPFTVRFRLGTP
jgi:hypothetical protein